MRKHFMRQAQPHASFRCLSFACVNAPPTRGGGGGGRQTERSVAHGDTARRRRGGGRRTTDREVCRTRRHHAQGTGAAEKNDRPGGLSHTATPRAGAGVAEIGAARGCSGKYRGLLESPHV